MNELSFASMHTRVRLLAADASRLPAARAEVERLAAALTRFDPASELCALNADPRRVVPASADLCAAVRAALAGARLTDGLADPTLLGELERAGYRDTLTERTPLARALRAAPPRRAAASDPAARWRELRVHADAIERPPGLRLDLGGSAKGFIADRVARLLGPPCAVDCGGDMRVSGAQDVHVRHPLTGGVAAVLRIDGAVATSGVDARLWGAAAHHLIDPSTREPAWSGALTATAAAPTAAEAEALAKAALLSGPHDGAAWLRDHGGVIVTERGEVRVLAAARPSALAARRRIVARPSAARPRIIARRNGGALRLAPIGSGANA